ncbi:MAG: FTR1 family protein [Anaerolineales bacterium]|nr:FTR1 family protein [Anaerolineales bacterium]
MLSSLLITLREGLEAALIIGIILAYLARTDNRQGFRQVWLGISLAVAVSLIAGVVIYFSAGELEGRAEQVFEGLALLTAAGVLTWMIFWMLRNSRQLLLGLESNVRDAVKGGQAWALFGIAFFAVLREGIETALFLSAAALSTSSSAVLFGGLLGIVAAVLIGWALFAATIRLNLERFFQVTSLLLILFAAGLFAHGIHEFVEVGWIPPILDPVWDINHILNEESISGAMLKTLFGYNGNPSLTEVLAYVSYFVVILFGLQQYSKGRPQILESTP